MNDPLYQAFSLKHIVGHRGSAKEAPENTLGGFQYLRSLNINKVELDVQLTKDNQPIMLHDESLNRTCGVPTQIEHLNYQELSAYNATNDFKSWPHKEEIPTLRKVLEAWPDIEEIQIEVKSPKKWETSAVTEKEQEAWLNQINQRIHVLIADFNLYEQAIITSEEKLVLEYSRTHNPNIKVGLVYETDSKAPAPSPAKQAKQLGCSHLILNYKLATKAVVAEAKESGLITSVWTVNDPNLAKKLVEEVGVDSVITDYVSKMKQKVSV